MKLHIFDFDGTLCNTPLDTPDNRKKYEKVHGIPWIIDKSLAESLSKKLKRRVGMRRGWFGRAETLEPPLVPDPAPSSMFIHPVCDIYHRSKTDPDAITIIMTGRHAGMKNHVLRILDDGGLVKCERTHAKSDGKLWVANVDPHVQVYCLGEDGPYMQDAGTKQPDTLPWKIWIMRQFLRLHRDIDVLEIWEDRDAHVSAFYDFMATIQQLSFDGSQVHYVPDIVADAARYRHEDISEGREATEGEVPS